MDISRIIIAGQGIAGTMLAFHFMKRGYADPTRLRLYDPGPEYGCSSVSQGAINPLVFKRMTLATGTEMIPRAWEDYRGLEQLLSQRGFSGGYLRRVPTVRIFRSQKERERWDRASAESGISGWTAPSGALPAHIRGVDAPWGGGVIPGSGWVRARALIRDFRSMLLEDRILVENFFPSGDTVPEPGEIIIHARGVQSRFLESSSSSALPGDRLPYYPVKGEVLTLELPQLESSSILSAGLTIQPGETPGIYDAGASYLRDFTGPDYRGEGTDWILSVLSAVLPLSRYELGQRIMGTRAGIRPSSRDRMAYAGPLSGFPGHYVLNGLGTRGFMLAPALASGLADHILRGDSLESRFHPRRVQI